MLYPLSLPVPFFFFSLLSKNKGKLIYTLEKLPSFFTGRKLHQPGMVLESCAAVNCNVDLRKYFYACELLPHGVLKFKRLELLI